MGLPAFRFLFALFLLFFLFETEKDVKMVKKMILTRNVTVCWSKNTAHEFEQVDAYVNFQTKDKIVCHCDSLVLR